MQCKYCVRSKAHLQEVLAELRVAVAARNIQTI